MFIIIIIVIITIIDVNNNKIDSRFFQVQADLRARLIKLNQI